MYGYIYLTTNIINGKKYIGRHKSSKFDESYKGSGTLLKQAFNEFGFDNFSCSIIEECQSEDELVAAEQYWVEKYNAVDDENFYNLIPGGSLNYSLVSVNISKALKGKPKSSTHKKHISESKIKNGSHKGENNPMFGKSSKPLKDKIAINDGLKDYFIDPIYLEDYLKLGYLKGGVKRPYSINRAEASRANIKAKVNFTTAGRVWYKNLSTFDTVYIDGSDIVKIQEYIDNGYIKGYLTKEEKLCKERLLNSL